MEENTRAPLCGPVWTNQVGYITLIAQLPGIYGDVNRPESEGVNPRQLGNNYYLFLCRILRRNMVYINMMGRDHW
jgi:hypothetical protein